MAAAMPLAMLVAMATASAMFVIVAVLMAVAAAAATTEAQHQVEAEQERVQDLRSKTQSALAETGAVVRSIVVNSVAEIERIKDALMSLKATYTQAQDDLTPEAPAETPEEPEDE